VPIRDPFEPPSPDKVVTRAISRAWPMTVTLPDLGTSFSVQPIAPSDQQTRPATGGSFTVTPGVYVLSARGPVDVATMPERLGQIGFKEFHAPPSDTVPLSVQSLAAPQYLAGRDAEVRASIVDLHPPDSAKLFVRAVPGGTYRQLWMRPAGGYAYAATISGGTLREGPHQFVVTVYRGDSSTTFPAGVRGKPTDWNYNSMAAWRFEVVDPATPLRIFDAATDASHLAFTRIGDAGRRGLFRVVMSSTTGQPAFHFELPVDSSGWSPPDYTASLVINSRATARKETITAARELRVRLRGLSARQTVHLTLMEDDGTSWSTTVTVDTTWQEQAVPLAQFTAGRGVLLPQGFPGEWNYWVGPATGRGGTTDRMQLEHLERVELSLRPNEGRGVEVEWVALGF
jgi:hypothetical protein